MFSSAAAWRPALNTGRLATQRPTEANHNTLYVSACTDSAPGSVPSSPRPAPSQVQWNLQLFIHLAKLAAVVNILCGAGGRYCLKRLIGRLDAACGTAQPVTTRPCPPLNEKSDLYGPLPTFCRTRWFITRLLARCLSVVCRIPAARWRLLFIVVSRSLAS